MTKIIAILSAVLLAVFGLTITATQPTETTETTDPSSLGEEVHELIGTVEEITDEYYLILTTDGRRIQVNLDASTSFDGNAPALGDLIHVFYDGKMTRSIPAQVTAQHFGCYYHTGAIVELTQEGFTLDANEQIIEVHAKQEILTGLENGQQVKVYTNGVMTMSLPAQVNADLVVPVTK